MPIPDPSIPLSEMEFRMQHMEGRTDVTEREVSWITRGEVLQINGSTVMKRLYTERVETDGGTLKQLVGKALAKEVALFLGYGWPNPLVEGAHEDLDPQARNCLDIAEEIHDFSEPRLVVKVCPRPDTQPDSQEGRRRGAFTIQLDFGPRRLLVEQSMLEGMVALLIHC